MSGGVELSSIELEIINIGNWIKEKVEKAGCEGVVFGLSGGVDSAVVAGICKKVFPETSLGLIMPCESIDEDEEHALILSDRLDLKIIKVDLTDTYRLLVDSLSETKKDNRLALSNIKPRLRMTTLYYYAQEKNYLVIGPTNKSEFITGYYTKNADSGVDLLPIADFVKEEIWNMARCLNIPDFIIDKKPSAGLWGEQTDEDEMGIAYDELDDYILNDKASDEVKGKIDGMYRRSAHKRSFPPIYKKNS